MVRLINTLAQSPKMKMTSMLLLLAVAGNLGGQACRRLRGLTGNMTARKAGSDSKYPSNYLTTSTGSEPIHAGGEAT